MRIAGVFALLLGIGGWGAETINFDVSKPGELPPGWTSAVTHRGGPPRWEVHPDPSAPSRPNVLAQLSGTASRFRIALAVFDKVVCRNGDLSVKFKVTSGQNERTAGLVWRYQDPYNYYFARADAAGDTISLYKVVRGNEQSINPVGAPAETVGVRHAITEGEWNILKVVIRDSRFTLYFDHRKVFTAEDDTFKNPGKTGVWVKGNTVAYFDDFRIDKK